MSYYYDIKNRYKVLYDEKDNKCKTGDDCDTGVCDEKSKECIKCIDDSDCKDGYKCDSDKGDCVEDDSQDVCYKGGSRAANFAENLGIAALNLFGLGGIPRLLGGYTPLEKAQSKVSELNNEVQKISNEMTVKAMSLQADIDKKIFNTMKEEQAELQAMINYNKEILDEEIHINTIYIAAAFILIMIILMYITYFTD
jgi:hypothetical protein